MHNQHKHIKSEHPEQFKQTRNSKRKAKSEEQKKQKPKHTVRKSKEQAVKDAIQQWWCDKPYYISKDSTIKDELSDEERMIRQRMTREEKIRANVTDMCDDQKLRAERMNKILGGYNSVMGPNVGTCSCVRCGVFCTDTEGKYQTTVEANLDQFRMAQDEYDALSSLERRFLHIVTVPADRIPAANAYYHICDRGLQNKVNGKWKWWHEMENDDRCKDIETARVFVCAECNDTVLSIHIKCLSTH